MITCIKNATIYGDTEVDDLFYVNRAEIVAQHSLDPSTKTGCVIVKGSNILAQSWNQLPEYVSDIPERRQRPDKYLYTEHSERMCFDMLAKHGISCNGATLYSNWFPCADCARGIIGCGIKRVVGFVPDTKHPKYGHEFEVSVAMLTEAGVEIVYVGERAQVQK